MIRAKLFLAFVLPFVTLAVLTSAPAPTDRIPLTPAGKVKVDNLVVNDAALIDENRVVIVGRTGSVKDDGPDVPDPNEGVPNGAIIDLPKKSVQHFANQHTAQIWSVSSYGGRVISGSLRFEEAVLRSWDLKVQESKEVAKFHHTPATYRLTCFHKSGRVVVDEVERLIVLSPAKPEERMELACPAGVEWLSYPLAVSPDDAWIACKGGRGQVVCFETATKKATVVPIAPKGDDADKWSVHGLAFAPSGKLYVCRGGNAEQVPKGKAEKDVPAEHRGIVRIELPEGKLVPLNMGHPSGTWGCAVDGGETWLSTVGWPDKRADSDHVGELRVYNFASGKLAYREQLKGGVVPQWVWFTPSGKRLVCATMDGVVRWWDVPVR
ncbi:MAG TPA: hypothetical protein VH592_17180 [Gemmataceae bacterium]|jgi:hypothetical protein